MTWNKMEISLLAGGFLIAIAGKEFGIPIATPIGIGIVALVIALVGLEAILTRKMKWGITWYSSETYQGIAAVSLGLILLTAGLGFGAMVVAQALNREQSLLELLFSRPGFVLLLVGGIMVFRGLAGVIGALEWNQTSVSRLLNGILERLAMLILLLLGAACSVLGALNIIAPTAFQQLIAAGRQTFLRMFGIQ